MMRPPNKEHVTRDPARMRATLRRVRRLCMGVQIVIIPVLVVRGCMFMPTTAGSISASRFNAEAQASVALDATVTTYGLPWRPWKTNADVTLTVSDPDTPGVRSQFDLLHTAGPYLVVIEDGNTGEHRTVSTDHWVFTTSQMQWNDDGSALMIPGWRVGEFRPGRSFDIPWLLIHIGLIAVIASMLLVAGWLIIRGLTHERLWIRPATWQCPACGYDLRGHRPGAGQTVMCPECGWRGASPAQQRNGESLTDSSENPRRA